MHSFRIIIACLIFFALPAVAGEPLAVVAKRSNPLRSISLETLKLVYLRKSMLDSNGTRWIPLNLPLSNELRQAFSLALFKKLPEDQEDYWNTQYFQGINPPQVLASEEAVLRFIALTPGAIGYVRKQSVDERVKVLNIIVIPANN